MIKTTIKILNKLGLHARPAGMLAHTAAAFKSDIRITNQEGMEVNAKSIMGLMTLAAGKNSFIEICADGPDEEKALGSIEKLIESRFDEEE